MIEEQGRVVARDGDSVEIVTERHSACGGCAARSGCGTGAIAKVLGRKRLRLRVVNSIDAHVGDRVVIGIDESGVVRGSLAVYAVPLAGLFAGATGFHLAGLYLSLSASDLPAIAGAVLGFVAGLVWLRRFGRVTATDKAFQPVVLRHDNSLPVR